MSAHAAEAPVAIAPETERYLAMQREVYASLAHQSDYSSEAFAREDDAEFVVGSYASHEAFDYERWLFGGVGNLGRARALEYGCGPGRMLLRLSNAFAHLDGADISQAVLDVAERRTARLARPPHLFAVDGRRLPSELDGTYDVAFSVICLQHICVRAIRRSILASLARCLKPGGLLTFQMGYGPGHQAAIDYYAECVDAEGTNGNADVMVLHPADIGRDLADLGFESCSFALTPTGPGDTHGAWIFVRAIKAGPSKSAVSTDLRDWPRHGFEPISCDGAGWEAARARQLEHGLLKEHAALRERLAAVEHARRRLSDALAFSRAAEGLREEQLSAADGRASDLRRLVNLGARQLLRVRRADLPRLRALVAGIVAEAETRPLRVGVFGSGVHTDWLLRETTLQRVPSLFVFDSDPARWGSVVGGRTVQPVGDIGQMNLGVVLVSSLAFQDEMVDTLASLWPGDGRIVTCYP